MTKKVNSDAFLQSFCALNLNEINVLLDDQEYYLNRQKSIFISYLTQCFTRIRLSGDTRVEATTGRCTFPSLNVASYTFICNNTKDYLELNLHVEDGALTGLTECYCFTSDFENKKGRRLYIDPKRGSTF